MKEARIHVDFDEKIEEDLVPLSETDCVNNSRGKSIQLYEGLLIKLYSDDLSSCFEKDNLIANGKVELNKHPFSNTKWNCRIDKSGIYNESQKK